MPHAPAMRRKFPSVLITLLVFCACLQATPGLAQDTAFARYVAGYQVVNLAERVNPCRFQIVDAAGDRVGTALEVSLAELASETYFPLAIDPLALRSLHVECELEYAIVGNLLAGDYSTGASFVLPDRGATVVDLPLLNLENSGYSTWYTVQNLGSETATISATYSDGTQTAPVEVPPLGIVPFFQHQEAHGAATFAGTVRSTEPVRATVIQESSEIMFAYSGIVTVDAAPANDGDPFMASQNPVFPLVNVGGGAGTLTGIQLMNTGTESTDVTVTYRPVSTGSTCSESRTISAGDAATFALEAFAGGNASNCLPGSRFVGSATVTANTTNQPLVGIVNQLIPSGSGDAYVGFAPERATATVILPLIMDRNGGYFTGFSVQQIGGPQTEVRCEFANSDYLLRETLEPGHSFTDIQQGKLAEGYVGSARCAADDPNARIVAVVNQLSFEGGVLMVYEGISAD